jgi:hypothetical protein
MEPGKTGQVHLRVYAKVIDGQQDSANRRIDDALGKLSEDAGDDPERRSH